MSASAESYSRPYIVQSSDRMENRNLRPISAEVDLHVPELSREVIKINAQDPSERSIYNLEGTGFHVADQVRLLLENKSRGISFADSIKQVEQDINGFNFEYLRESPVFGIPLGFAQKDGQRRVVGRLYGEKLWVDSTDATEREGVVKDSVKKAEEILLRGDPGTLVLIHSGEGWSNYQSRAGKLEALSEDDVKKGIAQQVKFPDAQTYLAYINPDTSITAVTLKSHMNISQSEGFMAALKGEEKPETGELSEKERIKQVVGDVLEFSPKDNIKPYDIVKKMKQIIGSNTAYVDSLGRDRTFDEMAFMLRNPAHLEELDGVTQKLSDKFSQYAEWRMGFTDAQVGNDLQIALGHTILNLMHEIRGPKTPTTIDADREYILGEEKPARFDARAMLEEMKKIPGCAGGGVEVESAGGSRSGVLEETDDHGSLEADCPDCGMKNTRERGGWIYECHGCGSTKIACGRTRGDENKSEEAGEESHGGSE